MGDPIIIYIIYIYNYRYPQIIKIINYPIDNNNFQYHRIDIIKIRNYDYLILSIGMILYNLYIIVV